MRMRSELSAKEQEDADNAEMDKLHNVYFTYQQDDDGPAVRASSAGGGSPGRPSSASKKSKPSGALSACERLRATPRVPGSF